MIFDLCDAGPRCLGNNGCGGTRQQTASDPKMAKRIVVDFLVSARHGLYPGQIDWGYDFIRVLAWLGLAKNIQLPANLPPRSAITPLTDRALDIAAPGQAELSEAGR